MADVAGITCTTITGSSRALSRRIVTGSTPGMDGVWAHDLGRSDSSFSFTLSLLSNIAGVNAWAVLLHLLQGTVVAVYDSRATTHTYCLIESVSELKPSPAYIPGTSITSRGEITIKGQVVA